MVHALHYLPNKYGGTMKKIFSLLIGILFITGTASADHHKKASSTKNVENFTADNTKINVRDRDPNEVTADQQAMTKSDVEVTKLIRQELMRDDSLSTYGQNVKIITDDGHVTLKGPVKSLAEKNKIIACAKKIAGADFVFDNLEIASE